ncbi:MAG: radical SAM protein [Burkholderiales bacterium]
MSAAQLAAHRPEALLPGAASPLMRARERMRQTAQWHPGQQMGRRWAVGCVALEITQRCNLDCTLCYLSESSEALKDIPLAEVFRRIDMIAAHYGPNTDVQITGGDPTLRRRDELLAIVKRVSDKGMRPALFTNGILASRELLAALAGVGLVDVAFHVDMTQQRMGFSSEEELNALRLEYIERARGLPLAVIFNTTVFDGNIHAIDALAGFFVAHSDVVRFASFQLQAETGRGVLFARGAEISIASVAARLSRGAGAPLNFDAFGTGHSQCNRYALGLIAGGRMHDLLAEPHFVQRISDELVAVQFDRARPLRTLAGILGWALSRPRVLLSGLGWLTRLAWRMKTDLVRGRGQVHKLSFFIHNFMDACHLEHDRVEACAFMVASGDGPVSMCVHNAKRDSYLLKPIAFGSGESLRFWNPLSGEFEGAIPEFVGVTHSRKTARGRAKRAPDKERSVAQAVSA